MESSPNRAKLIEAARGLFTAHGFAGVSVDDVAALAGLTKGAVYYQFPDKTALFVAACELVMGEIIAAVTNATMAQEAHHIDEIVTGSDLLFDAFEGDDARRLLVLEGPALLGPQRWASLIAPMRQELAEHALQHIADEGRLTQALVVPLSDVVMGAFNQAVLATFSPNSTPETAALARDAYRYLVAGLLRSSPDGFVSQSRTP
jgi:AcrR family transcriptional regulator